MKKRPKPYIRPGKSSITLKNVFNNLRDNELLSENKQITQCVFLGVLKLKPVPSIFYSSNPPVSAPVGRKLRRIRSRTLSRDTHKNSTKPIINKVISGRISKKNPETVKASIKKIPPRQSNIIKFKFNMNNQSKTETVDSNTLRLVPNTIPEKGYSSQGVNLNSLTATRQFNPVQNLFDKVKQKIGETQHNPNLSSADFVTNAGTKQQSEHISEIDSTKKSRTSPKRNSKKKLSDTDGHEVNGKSVLEIQVNDSYEPKSKNKERTSPRSKKSLNTESVIIISDDNTSTNKQIETEVIDVDEDSSSLNTDTSVMMQQKVSDDSKRGDTSLSDDSLTEKPKSRRSRLLPTAIPSIFLTAPRLLRSELAQKKTSSTEQKLKEKASKSRSDKFVIKSSSEKQSKISPKASRDKKIISDIDEDDDDILFVSEEIKSPNDGDKPSLKLLIRQKKRSEIALENLSDISSDKTNVNKITESRSLRSGNQKSPPKEPDVKENDNVLSLDTQNKIELTAEKQASIKKSESKHNLKDSIINVIDEQGLDSYQGKNSSSAITENNNLSNIMLEQIAHNINSNKDKEKLLISMEKYSDSEEQEVSSNKINTDVVHISLPQFSDKNASSEVRTIKSATRTLRSNLTQEINTTEAQDEVIVVEDESNAENNPQLLVKEGNPSTNDSTQVTVTTTAHLENNNPEKRGRGSQKLSQPNLSDLNAVDPQQPSQVDQEVVIIEDNALSKRSTRSIKLSSPDKSEIQQQPNNEATEIESENDKGINIVVITENLQSENVSEGKTIKTLKNTKVRKSISSKKFQSDQVAKKIDSVISQNVGKEAPKRKSVSENKVTKRAKQSLLSSDNTVNLNVSSRSLRSKTSSEESKRPLKSKTNTSRLNETKDSSIIQSRNNKENKSKNFKTKLKKNQIKIKSKTLCSSSNLIVQPSTSSLQRQDGKVSKIKKDKVLNKSRPSKPTAISESKNKKTIDKKNKALELSNLNVPKSGASVDKQKKNRTIKMHGKGKGMSKNEVKGILVNKHQDIEKSKKEKAPKKGKQLKEVEKLKNKSTPSKKVVFKIESAKKTTKMLSKNKVKKSEIDKKQSLVKTAATSKSNKAQLKHVLPKSVTAKQLLKSLGKKRTASYNVTKKTTTKTTVKKKQDIKISTKKSRVPLKIQNVISTRSRGKINLKLWDDVAKNKKEKKVKAVKKTDKTNDSAASTSSKSKAKQNKQSLNKTAKNKSEEQESKNKQVSLQTKNKKAKSLLILKKKKLLIERIIKSTLKQLNVQKQIKKSTLSLKARAQLRRKRQLQHRINVENSKVVADNSRLTENISIIENPSTSTNILNGDIVPANSNIVELNQDQKGTIIFLTATPNTNCEISNMPVIENIATNIICLDMNNTVIDNNETEFLNKNEINNQVSKLSPSPTRRSSRLGQVELEVAKMDEIEKVEKHHRVGRRKRKLEIEILNDTATTTNSQDPIIEEIQEGTIINSPKIRKVEEKPYEDEDLAQILSASEVVLRNIEQVTNEGVIETVKRKSGQLQKDKKKDMTVFDFNESDPEPETVPMRYKLIGNKNDEPILQSEELSPENSQSSTSPKKSPMKQATILEMFNRVAYKNQKTGFTAIKSIFTSTPKTSAKELSQERTKNQKPDNVDLLEEPLKEFQRKCLKINQPTDDVPDTSPKRPNDTTVIPPAIFKGLQKKCLHIHNTTMLIENQLTAETTPESTNSETVASSKAVKAKSLKNKSETDTFDMPPPAKAKVMKRNPNPDPDAEIFDDDDSRSEWMPQELAEYKFKYSAKKVMSYKPVFKCKVCLTIFPTYYKLSKHKQEHTDTQNPYACKQCEESFKNVDELVAHIRIHKGQHPYVCQKCDSGFWSKKAYDEHLPVHLLRKTKEAPKRFECDICKKKFAKLSDVERHSRVHTGEKPFECNICNKRFQQTHNLSKHLLIHLHLKPFNCEICGKKFGRIDVLNRHVLTHSLEKPYKCSVCAKDFIRISQLNRHYKVHPEFVLPPSGEQETSGTVSDQNSEDQSKDQSIAEKNVVSTPAESSETTS